MSLFKFHDTNAINKPNYPNIVASADTYNGYVFGITAGEAVAFADDAAAKAGELYVMNNIIDHPEIENTDDFHVSDGEYVRGARLRDFAEQKIDISQDLVYFRDTGTKQVETATVAGAIGVAGAGNAKVIITATGMTNSPKTISVAVANNDDATAVAVKIRTALTADADVGHATTGFFVVSGETDKIILTVKTATANDATMNIAIDNDNCSGLTAAPTSANTTPGKTPITTNALMWADLAAGDILVPRVTADTTNTFKWKKVASATGYGTYLEVIKKTTFGSFTYEKPTGTVLGGLLCKVKVSV